MKRRSYYTKTRGQSIPLIAGILVALFAMAALSMDVGTTYAEQRELVRATNAAALEGMDALIDGRNAQTIGQRIETSLRSNRIPLTSGVRQIGEVTATMYFLDATGRALLNCPIKTCSSQQFQAISKSIKYLRVETKGDVSTTFARVVGQDALGIAAVAHAARTPCQDGIYPIAVPDSLIDFDNGRFKEPDSLYSDEYFMEKTVKKIYLRQTSDMSGSFGFMSWGDPKGGSLSANMLAKAFTGPGTIGDGFEEVDPWPSNVTSPVEPDNYPSEPGLLSTGDWIHAATGNKFHAGPVGDELQNHVESRTIMMLPIFDAVTDGAGGGGANGAYHFKEFGRFYIRSIGVDKIPGSPENKEYIELVYLGPGKDCASLVTPPTTVGRTVTLEGQVSLFPHYAQIGDLKEQPIQFVIVLDVSGSMSWTMDGRGTDITGNTNAVCQGGSAVCSPVGTQSGYQDVTERRIYIAGERLKQFANSLRTGDQVKIVTYSGAIPVYAPDEAVDIISHEFPAGRWEADKGALTTLIDQVTKGELDGNYSTSGETPSAIGLARAQQIFDNAVTTDPLTFKPYKRVVIFMTDGVANVDRGGMLNVACTAAIDCNEGYTDTDPPTAKPITAMHIERASLVDQLTNEESIGSGVYAIALGNTDDVAMSLAPFAPRLYQADTEEGMTTALNAIRQQAYEGTCADGGAARLSPIETIPPGSLPDYAQLNHPLVTAAPNVGMVTLRSGANEYTGFIQRDSSGIMFYRIPDLPAGTYSMSYWLAYKSPEDGITRVYDFALPLTGGGALATETQPITLNPGSDNLGSIIRPIVMDIDPTVDVCQNVTP